jgi:hypothetical protein
LWNTYRAFSGFQPALIHPNTVQVSLNLVLHGFGRIVHNIRHFVNLEALLMGRWKIFPKRRLETQSVVANFQQVRLLKTMQLQISQKFRPALAAFLLVGDKAHLFLLSLQHGSYKQCIHKL